MIDPKFAELMNLELDGTATPSQRADLERHLAAHPEARAHYEELSRIVRRLDSHPMHEPPAELHPRVIAALDGVSQRRPLRHAPSEHGFGTWLGAWLVGTRLRAATTFGLGLVTGVFLLAAVQYGRSGAWDMARDVDPSRVSGSMMEPSAGDRAIGTIPVSVDAGDVTGSATVYQSGSAVHVDLGLNSEGPVEWVLSFEPAAWNVVRVARAGGSSGRLSVTDGEIRGSHTGEGGVVVTLTALQESTQPFVLKVVKSGRVVFEQPTPPLTH